MAFSQPRSTRRTLAPSSLLLGSHTQWRFLMSPPAPGADNMALDHALMRRAAETGEAVLRVYSWRQPTLSLGRHQPARGIYDAAAIQSFGVDVVRRPTGGRAVLHHREVTYCVVAPLSGDNGAPRKRVRDIYTAVNELLADALLELGAPVTVATDASNAPPHLDSPCFDTAAMGELVADGRKLVGSAQWREGRAVLQHGSILVDDDQYLLTELAPTTAPARVATLRRTLGRAPSFDEIASALRHALNASLERAFRPACTVLDPDSVQDGFSKLRTHYADPAWTWRL